MPRVKHLIVDNIDDSRGLQVNVLTGMVGVKVDGVNVKVDATGTITSHPLSNDFNGIRNDVAVTEVALRNGLASIQSKVERDYCPYNVGDILYTMATYNPATRYPGTTWIKHEGRIMIGTNAGQNSGITGGSRTKTISEANMPPHQHIQGKTERGAGIQFGSSGVAGLDTFEHHRWYANQPRALTSSTGGGVPLDIMPPHITCHIWQRLT